MNLEQAQQQLGMQNISLNRIIDVNLNYQVLREILEKLMIQMGSHMQITDERFRQKDTQQMETNMEIKDIKNRQRDLTMKQETHNERINSMNELSQNQRKLLQNTHSQAQSQSQEFKQFQEEISLITEQILQQKQNIQLFQSKLQSFEKLADITQGGGGIGQISEFYEEINQTYLSKEIFNDKWREFERFKDLAKDKIDSMMNLNPRLIDTQFKEIQARLTPLEEQIRTKIDCDIFDEEIDRIRTILSHTSTNSNISAKSTQILPERGMKQKDILEIKEKAQKIEECLIACINFEKKLQQFSDLNSKLDQFEEVVEGLIKKSQMEEVEIEIQNQKLNMIQLKSFMEKYKGKFKDQGIRLDSLQLTSDTHDSLMRRIKEQIDEFKVQLSLSSKSVGNGQHQTQKKDKASIEDKFLEIMEDFTSFKETFNSKLQTQQQITDQIQKNLQKKLDKQEFDQFQESELNGGQWTEAIIQQMKKVFADKKGVGLQYSKIQSEIQYIMEFIQQLSANGKFKKEDDAMLTKKSGQQQCLSCDKNIPNLSPTPADYNAWSKLPLKESGDRIARFGKGFSRILGNLHAEQQTFPIHQNQTGYNKIKINDDKSYQRKSQLRTGYMTERAKSRGDFNPLSYTKNQQQLPHLLINNEEQSLSYTTLRQNLMTPQAQSNINIKPIIDSQNSKQLSNQIDVNEKAHFQVNEMIQTSTINSSIENNQQNALNQGFKTTLPISKTHKKLKQISQIQQQSSQHKYKQTSPKNSQNLGKTSDKIRIEINTNKQ
eukprot:403358803